MLRKLLQTLMTAAALSLTALTAWAQTSTAELRGQVLDQSNAAVAGAKITLTDTAKGTARTVTTDGEGSYFFPNLLPGDYEILVEAASFTQTRVRVSLTVGQEANIPIRLTAGPLRAEVAIEVVEGEDLLEKERTQQSNTIESRQIQNLPISRRSYLDYALLTPGVTDSDSIADGSDFRVAQTPQSGLSFGGSNGRGNSVSLDGADVTGASGGVRGSFSQEAVQEFQILRNSYNPEFGGASGGVVNIVSKTGGNQYHGSVFGYFRSQRFDARNVFDFNPRGKSDFDRQQFGGSFGGPLKRDRTFFFGALERLNQNENTFVNLLNDPNIFRATLGQQTLFGFLAGTPFAALGTNLNNNLTTTSTNYPRTVNLFTTATGQFPFDARQTQGSFRVDHNFSDRSNGYARFDVHDTVTENQAAGALTAVSRGRTIDISGSDFLISHNYQFTDTLFNEFKAQFAYQNAGFIPNDAIGPEFNIEGFGNFNRDIFLPSRVITRHYDYADNMTKLAGHHTVKFGGYFNFVRNTTDSETFFPGRFNFGAAIPLANIIPAANLTPLNTFLRNCNINRDANPPLPNCNATGAALGADANANGIADSLDAPINALQAFNLGLPTSYQQGFGTANAASWTARTSYYVQDTWKVAPNFTLNYGLRYYVSNEPFLLPTYKGDFQPRAGFSWDPFKRGRTVLRAGAGIFVGTINNAVANVTFKQSAEGRPSDIYNVLATPQTAMQFGLPRSFDVYQALLVATNFFSRPIVLADLANILPPVAVTPAGITRRPIVPGPNSILEVRTRLADGYRSPTTYQASLGVQQELGGGFTAEVSYLFVRGLYLPRSRDINIFKRAVPGGPFIRTPTPAQVAAGLTSDFRNPVRFQDNLFESAAQSFYHAGTIQILKRFSNNLGLNAHYTWSKAIDEVTDFNADFAAQNPLNANLDRALSAFDQRHRLVMSAIFVSPLEGDSLSAKVFGDWRVAPIFIANSGRPFNLLLGFDANNDARSQTDRPGAAGRNTGLGEPFYSFDLRLSRRFFAREARFLELTLEGFNLFNHSNLLGINNIVGTTFAGRADFRARGDRSRATTQPLGFTSATEARKLQFGLRLNF